MDAPAPTAAEALALLRRLGAQDIDHPGGTLLAHLIRVRDRLTRWEARPALQLAGLCHAFYGTDGFATALLPTDRRAELTAVIGAEAEAQVHFYASCDRTASYPTLADPAPAFHDRFTGRTWAPPLQQRRDFAELTAANELDLVDENPQWRARWGPDLLALFTRFRPLLSDHARRDCARTLGTP
ncbi:MULTISPECIES: DUF6817 domain-containing protein [Streptomyces]|uniref:DUF6817 domain-containing protein n=1 Tax=Streptomyces dengpaensis TaxID=2049881 RepID=A0ABM6ST29_9ACTN|nr:MULTISPECIES: hypothetical protein [Streptomyces]AVH57905.1 hypothetical protein C4B68_21460 [Streptomyces dengpaensis]PIB03909.1 hypothetical protein B1C81_35260 [Streptomyces sp. HG99]